MSLVLSNCLPQAITHMLTTGGGGEKEETRSENCEAHLKHYQIIIMSLDLKQIS